MFNTLMHALIQISLSPDASDLPADARTVLETASMPDWRRALTELECHRITGLVFFALKAHGLLSAVPDECSKAMAALYLKTLSVNRVILGAAAGALGALDSAGVHPIVFKGVVLADYFYPDPGTRQMGDFDMLIAPAQVAGATAAFESVRFTSQKHDDQKDGTLFHDPRGVPCDLHYRFRLFDKYDLGDLSAEIVPRHLDRPLVRVFEPTAMLAHLVAHLAGHMIKTGPILMWLIDIHFVLRTWSHEIDPVRLVALLALPEHRALLGTVLHFFETSFGRTPPPALAGLSSGCPVLTLSDVLRRRRLKLWRLPSADGWARLAATRFGIRQARAFPELEPSDYLLWIGDACADRRFKTYKPPAHVPSPPLA